MAQHHSAPEPLAWGGQEVAAALCPGTAQYLAEKSEEKGAFRAENIANIWRFVFRIKFIFRNLFHIIIQIIAKCLPLCQGRPLRSGLFVPHRQHRPLLPVRLPCHPPCDQPQGLPHGRGQE